MAAKSVALFVAIVALVAVASLHRCDAGLLEKFGRGAENFGTAIHKGASKTEERLTNLFGGKKEEKQNSGSVLPPDVLSKSPFQEKMVDDLNAPSIEIVYGESTSTTTTTTMTQKSEHGAAVITDNTDFGDDDDDDDLAAPKSEKDPSGKESIVGAPRCAPGEIFVNDGCRLLEE